MLNLQKKYRESFGKDKLRAQTRSNAHLNQILDKEKGILFDRYESHPSQSLTSFWIRGTKKADE